MRSARLVDGTVWDGKDPKVRRELSRQGRRVGLAEQENAMVAASSTRRAGCRPRRFERTEPPQVSAPWPRPRPRCRRRRRPPSAAFAARPGSPSNAFEPCGCGSCRPRSASPSWSASGPADDEGRAVSDRPADLRRSDEALRRPFYRNGPNDQGHRLEHPVLAAARRHRLRPRGGGRHPAGFIGRLAFPRAHGLAAHQPAAPGLAAGLAADRPARLQAANPAAIWTIFICSIWPMIINTAVA